MPRLHTAWIGLVFAVLSASAARADCVPERVGEGAATTCARSDPTCVAAHVPDEVRAIGPGLAVEWAGLSVNDGRARWTALDIGRAELIVVERFAGRQFRRAPRLDAPTAHDFLRTGGAERSPWRDRVRRYGLGPDELARLACLAAEVWTTQPLPTRELTDMASRVYLLRPDAARVDDVRGQFAGPVAAFERAVTEVRRARRPGPAPEK